MPASRYRATLSAVVVAPVLLALSLGTMAASARVLFGVARDADVLDYASALEKGAVPDAEYLASFVRGHGVASPGSDCGDLITRSRLTITLAAHQAAANKGSVGLIDESFANALSAAEHRLACSPLDGNAWLQLARLRSLAEGPRPDIVEDLKMSWLTAPSESWILEPRLDFETGLLSARVSGLDVSYGEDLRRFAAFEPTARVARVYVNQNVAVNARLRPLIETDAEPRKRAIVAEIDRLGVDFNKP